MTGHFKTAVELYDSQPESVRNSDAVQAFMARIREEPRARLLNGLRYWIEVAVEQAAARGGAS